MMQMGSAFQLYEQRLSENRRREKQMLCVQLHNITAHSLESPCSGSVLHPTALLAFSLYYSTSRDSHLCQSPVEAFVTGIRNESNNQKSLTVNQGIKLTSELQKSTNQEYSTHNCNLNLEPLKIKWSSVPERNNH